MECHSHKNKELIVKGDNTAAFGGNFLTISLDNETGTEIIVTKAVFACGPIRLEFNDPVFPLTINLTEEQTAQLDYENECYLAVWDGQGRKLTCKGTLAFGAEQRKV